MYVDVVKWRLWTDVKAFQLDDEVLREVYDQIVSWAAIEVTEPPIVYV